MHKSTVLICETDNVFSLNSEKPHLENYTQISKYDVRCLVEDEEEEEKQPLLQKQNKVSCFNWKSLLLLGVGSLAMIGGVVLYATRGKTEGQ